MTTASSTTTSSTTSISLMTRREFLYYIWAASMALFTAQAGAALLWYAYPRFKTGTFGGLFELDISEVPPPDSPPKAFSGGRYWLVNLGDQSLTDPRQPKDYVQTKGIKAIYMVCVHLGCLYAWVPTNDRWECPCHGSKFLLTGTRTEGPAQRNLDTFVTQALDTNGNVVAETRPSEGNEEGSAIDVSGAARLRINTGKRIPGAVNTKPGGGR